MAEPDSTVPAFDRKVTALSKRKRGRKSADNPEVRHHAGIKAHAPTASHSAGNLCNPPSCVEQMLTAGLHLPEN